MKVCFNLQSENQNKHPLMPGGYPWTQYEVSDEFSCPDGFTEMPLADFIAYRDGFDLSAYLAATEPSQHEKAKAKVAAARDFGEELIADFAAGNMLLGIVAAGKTQAVTTYLHQLNHFIENGSLYAAIEELEALMSAGVPADLAPFVTEARLVEFQTRIETYLS